MSDGQLALNTNLASPGLFFKDSNGDAVKVGPVHVGTTAPNATPGAGGQAGNSKGEMWLDNSGSDYTLKTWDGSAWREIVVTSTMIKDGTIVNADVNASAAIAHTKLANITAGNVLLGNASNVPTSTALSGDVTVSNAGVTAIGSGVIVNADVNASAAIAGTKISPDFGSQNIATTGNLQVTSINGGPLAGFRNAIINGNFDHWQRGTSFTTSEYGADRWVHIRAGTTQTVTRQPFTIGQTAVPGEPTYFCRTVVTSVAGASNNCLLVQRIEGVRTFAGQQVTVSFWAKADATKNISVSFSQYFGSGGSPSANVDGIGVTKVSIGTNWQKVTVTATVPSVSGKTTGTDNVNNFLLRIYFDAGSSFDSITDTLGQQSGTFDIAQVQVEAGPVATPFERRPVGTELALCQRYYSRWLPSNSLNFPAHVASSVMGFLIVYPQEMRVAPTLATSLTGAIFSSCSFSSFSAATENGARFVLISSAISNNASITFGVSDYLEASAEL